MGLPKGEDQYLDNRPLVVTGESGPLSGPAFVPKVASGGLFSFDNMHLSSVGYEIMARAVEGAMFMDHDKLVAPLLGPHGEDPCKAPGDAGYADMKHGDCINIFSQPGWSYVDATRRDFMLLRVAGSSQMTDLQALQTIYGIAWPFFGGR
jgi:hypothetical protein